MKKYKSVSGIVIPSAWGDDGNVKSVTIAAFDERRYRVKNNHMALKLRDYLKCKVEVEGIIIKENNEMTIDVKKIQEMEA